MLRRDCDCPRMRQLNLVNSCLPYESGHCRQLSMPSLTGSVPSLVAWPRTVLGAGGSRTPLVYDMVSE